MVVGIVEFLQLFDDNLGLFGVAGDVVVKLIGVFMVEDDPVRIEPLESLWPSGDASVDGGAACEVLIANRNLESPGELSDRDGVLDVLADGGGDLFVGELPLYFAPYDRSLMGVSFSY